MMCESCEREVECEICEPVCICCWACQPLHEVKQLNCTKGCEKFAEFICLREEKGRINNIFNNPNWRDNMRKSMIKNTHKWKRDEHGRFKNWHNGQQPPNKLGGLDMTKSSASVDYTKSRRLLCKG